MKIRLELRKDALPQFLYTSVFFPFLKRPLSFFRFVKRLDFRK